MLEKLWDPNFYVFWPLLKGFAKNLYLYKQEISKISLYFSVAKDLFYNFWLQHFFEKQLPAWQYFQILFTRLTEMTSQTTRAYEINCQLIICELNFQVPLSSPFLPAKNFEEANFVIIHRRFYSSFCGRESERYFRSYNYLSFKSLTTFLGSFNQNLVKQVKYQKGFHSFIPFYSYGSAKL